MAEGKRTCPAGLDADIRRDGEKDICEKYLTQVTQTGLFPSMEYCPKCEYNPDRQRR